MFILPHVANATHLCYHSYCKKSSLFDIPPHPSGEGAAADVTPLHSLARGEEIVQYS